MFESRSQPYQYDKSYQFRQAEARRNCKDIFQRRGLTTSGGEPKRGDMSLTSLFSNGETEVLVPHEHLGLARCASAPSIKSTRSGQPSSERTATPSVGNRHPRGSPCVKRPASTPGKRWQTGSSKPVWHTHGMSTEAHIPGYFGHIPGFRMQTSTVGCRFASGTQALRDLSKPGGQVPREPPPPFEGGTPNSNSFAGSVTDCTPWIGTLRGRPAPTRQHPARKAPLERSVKTITA